MSVAVAPRPFQSRKQTTLLNYAHSADLYTGGSVPMGYTPVGTAQNFTVQHAGCMVMIDVRISMHDYGLQYWQGYSVLVDGVRHHLSGGVPPQQAPNPRANQHGPLFLFDLAPGVHTVQVELVQINGPTTNSYWRCASFGPWEHLYIQVYEFHQPPEASRYQSRRIKRLLSYTGTTLLTQHPMPGAGFYNVIPRQYFSVSDPRSVVMISLRLMATATTMTTPATVYVVGRMLVDSIIRSIGGRLVTTPASILEYGYPFQGGAFIQRQGLAPGEHTLDVQVAVTDFGSTHGSFQCDPSGFCWFHLDVVEIP